MFGSLSAKVLGLFIGTGVLAAAGWFLVHTIERAALAEAETEGYKIVLKKQNKAVKDYEQRLQDHQRKTRAIKHELSQWKQKWKDIQDQPEVAEWVHTPIPDPVRERVRELIAPPGDRDPYGGAFIGADPLALLFLPDKRGFGGVSGRVPAGSENV